MQLFIKTQGTFIDFSRHPVRGGLREQRGHVVPWSCSHLVPRVEVRRLVRPPGHPPLAQPQVLLQLRRPQRRRFESRGSSLS